MVIVSGCLGLTALLASKLMSQSLLMQADRVGPELRTELIIKRVLRESDELDGLGFAGTLQSCPVQHCYGPLLLSEFMHMPRSAGS